MENSFIYIAFQLPTMSEPTLESILQEIRASRADYSELKADLSSIKSDLSDFKMETTQNFKRVWMYIEELARNTSQINGRLLTIENDLGMIKRDIFEIREDIRKIKKFVPTDHADFPTT